MSLIISIFLENHWRTCSANKPRELNIHILVDKHAKSGMYVYICVCVCMFQIMDHHHMLRNIAILQMSVILRHGWFWSLPLPLYHFSISFTPGVSCVSCHFQTDKYRWFRVFCWLNALFLFGQMQVLDGSTTKLDCVTQHVHKYKLCIYIYIHPCFFKM